MDINSLSPNYFLTGKGLKEINWLRTHGPEFGFEEVYTPRSTGRMTGYEPEAWHWTYFPLSKIYLTAYLDSITYGDINGFSGSYLAKDLNIIQDYIENVPIRDHD
jgi:hypothetical protein